MVNIYEIIIYIFSTQLFQSAAASSTLIILLEFVLEKTGVFNKTTPQILSTILFALPLPSFIVFMTNIDQYSIRQEPTILIWGFVIYAALILASKLLYKKYKGNIQSSLIVCTVFCSTTFFSIPIISVLYGSIGIIYADIFYTEYLVFLYSYKLIKMSGVKFDKKNIKDTFLNPIIARFLGIFIWIFKAYLPQAAFKSRNKTIETVSLRIDQTVLWLFPAMKRFSSSASPPAWLAIGNTLSIIFLQKTVSSKDSWYYSFNKVFPAPFLSLIIIPILTAANIIPLPITASAVVVMATPKLIQLNIIRQP